MDKADDITTTESFGPQRKRATASPTVEASASTSAAVDPTPAPMRGAASVSKDVESIAASTAAIRAQTATLPNSDMLATVLLSVTAIENALVEIAGGLAALETVLAEEDTPA